MSWSRAVWIEDKIVEEGVVPSIWIQEKTLRWPKVNNALRLLKQQASPLDNWCRFHLVKIKFTSGMFISLSFRLTNEQK